MKALLIVDMQNDFLPGGALAIEGADQIIPIINSLIDKFSCVIATKDWHPPNHISFAPVHGKKPGDRINVGHSNQELWPVHCVQYSSGSDFSPQLRTENIRKVFFKGVEPHLDSYSAFFDNAHNRSTGLEEYLKKMGADEIYLAGFATDYCIKFSALDALHLGFKVSVILDACRSIELRPGDTHRAVEEMKQAGVHLLKSEYLFPISRI